MGRFGKNMKRINILDNRKRYLSKNNIVRKNKLMLQNWRIEKLFLNNDSLDLCLIGSNYMYQDNFSITDSIYKVKIKTKKSL